MPRLDIPATVPLDAVQMKSKDNASLMAKLSVGGAPKESAWMRMPGPEPVWYSVWTGSERRAVVYQRGDEVWLHV